MSSSSSPIILKAGGNRNDIVDEKEAKEIISRFEAQKGSNGNDLVLSLDLSCRSWTPKAMNMVLLEYLSQQFDLTKVETLHLSDIIASQNTEDGLTILNTIADVFATSKSKSSSSSNLRCLDLSDNALGDRGMDKLVPLLSSASSSLNRITFRNCGLGLHSITVFVDSIISTPSSSSSSLTDLILDKNMLGVDGAKIVGEKLLPFCESLQHFSYAGCRPQRSGSKYICDGLAAANTKSLRYLNLDDCTIGDGNDDENDGVTSLCVALRRSSGLRYLNLRDGDMGPDGWKQVAEALSDAKASLTHLILESNQIGSDDEGITALTDYIRNHAVRTLIELNVEANELGDDGLRKLLCPFRADWNVLESFNLNDNELEDPIPLIMAAGDFPNLKKLDVLDDNDELSSSSSARGALKQMYKDRLVCGEDDEDEDDDDDDDEVDDKLSKLMGIMKL